MNKKNIILNIGNFLLLNFLIIKDVMAQMPHDLGTISGLETGYDTDGDGIADATEKLESILSNVIGFLTILSGLYFFVMFITAGLSFASAGGDSGKVEEAKTKMTNGVIGLIIVVASYSIIFIVGKVLGFDILNPGTIIVGLDPNATP